MENKANAGKPRREKGTGTIWQKENGTWMGKLDIGKTAEGKRKFKSFSGKTQAEVKRKIREFLAGDNNVDKRKITVEEYIWNWAKLYKHGSIKSSSYDAIEKTIRNHIVPFIGMIQLQQLTSDDIQELLKDLKNKHGYSHSTVKKVYDCLKQMLTHATINDDIVKNPMLLIKPPDKRQFETKEIKFFDRNECALIVEEASRLYKTGKPVYVYADAYILMLNTGIRMGEAIGLEKRDWDQDAKTLHIRRNVQSVFKRDSDGERIGGKELIYNTTKTYSGDRIIPLNKNATEALNRLCSKYPNSKYIIADSKESVVPPERLERTFYRILDNVSIPRTGLHSLRHTFASTLFAKKVDIKTISKLLGHASIQITIDTYIHLFENIDHNAVAQLDNEF